LTFSQAWKADISLQLHLAASNTVDSLVSICQHKSVHTDLTLLDYVYSLLLKATRKADPKNLTVSSVGTEGVKAWQNAAANCKTKRDRKELWDSFFDAAIREDCWEDVRIVCDTQSLPSHPMC
jgi:N-terminal acetyltransferase B complex non-catalytic subunit